LYQHLS